MAKRKKEEEAVMENVESWDEDFEDEAPAEPEEPGAWPEDDEPDTLEELPEEVEEEAQEEPDESIEAEEPETVTAGPVLVTPKPRREVKVMNGITSTDYNRMRKDTKDTPHRFAVRSIGEVVRAQINDGLIPAATDEEIDRIIHEQWESAIGQSERLTYIWYQNISSKAKRRLYNAVRAVAMA